MRQRTHRPHLAVGAARRRFRSRGGAHSREAKYDAAQEEERFARQGTQQRPICAHLQFSDGMRSFTRLPANTYSTMPRRGARARCRRRRGSVRRVPGSPAATSVAANLQRREVRLRLGGVEREVGDAAVRGRLLARVEALLRSARGLFRGRERRKGSARVLVLAPPLGHLGEALSEQQGGEVLPVALARLEAGQKGKGRRD